MSRLRHLTLAFTLAFALALGQYAGLVHALGHATEQLSHKPGTPAKIACDLCFTCSQLASGAAPALLRCEAPAGITPRFTKTYDAIRIVSSVVFLSRAPPVPA